MLTVVKNTENSNVISIPADEMEKLRIKDGDEVEIHKENDEIIIRTLAEAERKRKFEQAREKVFEEWHDVFAALAKGADDETTNDKKESKGNFVLTETESGKYKFLLTTRGGKTVFESRVFESREDARREIDLMKKEISEIKEKILDFPIKSELETV